MLNGARIGSNRYDSGAPLDRYRVERWLVPGRNRLVVELRSPSGAGGFWFELSAGGQQLARSDGSWTIYETTGGASSAIARCRPASARRLLGRSPLGRWGSPAPGPERPTFETALAAAGADSGRAPPDLRRARALARRPAAPGAGRRAGAAGRVRLRRRTDRLSAALLSRRAGPAGRHATLGRAPGLRRTSRSARRRGPLRRCSGRSRAPGSTRIRRCADSAMWRSPACPESSAPRSSRRGRNPGRRSRRAPRAELGIFGVRPPPSSAPVEHEVWRELERAAGSTVGKDR